MAAAALPERVEAATVDHGLRPESADEARDVAEICSALGVPHEILTVTVEPGNLQSAARSARYAALAGWMERRNLTALATAHHADDQAETLLMRLNRASGVAGLAGVRARGLVPGTELPLLRPLLGWRRTELGAIVAAAGVVPAQDPSNSNDRFDRVRLRKELAAAERAVRADRQSAQAWEKLARVRFLQAQGNGYDQNQGVFTDAGKAELAQADRAWQQTLRLTKKPDPNIASLMVQAYGPGGLAQPADAVAAFEFVLAARQQTSEMYLQYAALAYQAGQLGKGDLAGKRAVALAPKLQRDNIKQQVAQLKQPQLERIIGVVRVVSDAVGRLDHLFSGTVHPQPSTIDPQAAITEPCDGVQAVRDEYQRAPLVDEPFNPLQALLLEREVADRKHFVQQQNVRVKVGRYGECEPHLHTAGVPLNGRV